MTTIRSTPTDAHEPPVDPVVQAQPPQPVETAAETLHPEQDPVAALDPAPSAEPGAGDSETMT